MYMSDIQINVLTEILKIINDSNFKETLVEMVLKRLESFSYSVKENDSWTIAFSIQKVENHIKNTCNVASIPEGLYEVFVDMVCGEVLYSQKQCGKLDETFNLEQAITKVKAGDTDVTLSTDGTPEQRLNAFINYLINAREGELICYRKIRW